MTFKPFRNTKPTAFIAVGTNRPVDYRGPIQPMSPADVVFWRERKRASAEREARIRSKSNV